MASKNTTFLETGDIFADRYKVVRLLGIGGMGQVYLVEDKILDNEEQALKVLNSDLSENDKQVKRFLQEVKLTRRVSSPNVVKTFDVNVCDGRLYFSMEYVSGFSLKEKIGTTGLPVDSVVDILHGICIGLKAIHKAQIIHRDLKPANIILTHDQEVKIADFGVAKTGRSDLTSHDEVIGSSQYLAPECWTGKNIDHRSDIYSLGVIVYKMLTGVLPFDGDTPAQIMFQHLQGELVPVSEIVDSVPTWLDNLIIDMLAVEPEERPYKVKDILKKIDKSSDGSARTSGINSLIDQTSREARDGTISDEAYSAIWDTPSSHTDQESQPANESLSDIKKPRNPSFGEINIKEIDESKITKKIIPKSFRPKDLLEHKIIESLLVLIATTIIIYLLLFPIGSILKSLLDTQIASKSFSSSTTLVIALFSLLYCSIVISAPLFFIVFCRNSLKKAFGALLKSTAILTTSGILFSIYYTLSFLIKLDSASININSSFIFSRLNIIIQKIYHNFFEIGLLFPEGTFFAATISKIGPDFMVVDHSSFIETIPYYVMLMIFCLTFFLFALKGFEKKHCLTIMATLLVLWVAEFILRSPISKSLEVVLNKKHGEIIGLHYISLDYYYIVCGIINWLVILVLILVIFPILKSKKPKIDVRRQSQALKQSNLN